jgi:NAD(P)H dehydrogenase (quinone)
MIGVTGAAGKLGRLVIDELLHTVPASEIIAIARDTAKASDLAAKGITIHQGFARKRPQISSSLPE